MTGNLDAGGREPGANPRTVFFRVTLPLILPGVISGALLRLRHFVRRGGDRAVLGGPGR